MRYVIMANGKGTRWNNYDGIPKHLINIGGETLLQRTTRLVHAFDPQAEVVITSHNPDCVAQGARRYEPLRSEREIDRFCVELVQDGVCFLYGDAFYSTDTIRQVVEASVEDMLFFGNPATIVAVKVAQGECMLEHLRDIDRLIEQGAIADAKGWQLYHHLMGMPLDGKDIAGKFVVLEDRTTDFNRPEDYEQFVGALENERAQQ
ncbi:MAG: NTP transferase domain-containing protein [Coriobacteriia bacterium]|nr:NTP transferase domain-containing protein [Coriobacteriia bacterium]